MVERSARQVRRNCSPCRSTDAEDPRMRTEMTCPMTGTERFERSTDCSEPMSTALQRSTASRICWPVSVTVHVARGFGGLVTARSAGSAVAPRYGWFGSGVQTHVPPLRTTRLPKQPYGSVYPPFELAKYARIAALL